MLQVETTVDIGSFLGIGSFFKITSIGALVSGILGASLVAAGIGFILYFLWGAMRWLSAGSDKAQVESARQKITNAFIGLVLVAAAWAIYLIVIYVLGLGNVINVGSSGGPPDPGGTPPPAGTCAGGTPIGTQLNDGGAGGYCTGSGAAIVQCNAADGHLDWPHFDPCHCLTGSEIPGYDFSTC